MKRPFVMVHDYGSGAVIVKIYAKSLEDVKAILPPPEWQSRSEDDPWIKDFPHKFLETDIDSMEDWLKQLVYMSRRKAEGKTSFPVRGRKWGIFKEERNLWARSIEEVKERFPTLEFRYYVPWSCQEQSDIDVDDEFTLRYEVKLT